MPLFLQDVERECDVRRRERRAVVEPRRLAQMEPELASIVGDDDRVRDEAVHGICLVGVRSHQRVEDEFHAGGAVAGQD